MRVASVGQPVNEDLAEVEAALQEIKNVDSPRLRGMLEHVLAARGKRLRPTIVLLAGHFGDYRPERLVPLAAGIELAHTATLLHDDLIDGSQTRRGRATANARYDNAAAVVLGDYLFVRAGELVANARSIKVARLFARAGMAVAIGELSQDMSTYECSGDVEDYFQRIARKTASVFAASAEAGALVAKGRPKWSATLRSYGENLGMAFQIVDDILDFNGDEAEMGKPVGSDLMQGVLTLPSLLLMKRNPKDNPVKKLFNGRRREEHLAEAALMIQNSDILEESYEVARGYRDRAVAALDRLPDIPARVTLIELADHVLERRS